MNRRKNLLLWGMSIPTDNSESARKQIQNFLNKNLDVNITVVNVNRTGARSYAIKLDKISQKREILEKKNILINKGICVYIEPHLTKRERIIQNIIQKKAEDERAKGRYVKVGHQRLFINDERWIWDKSQMKLVEAVGKRSKKVAPVTRQGLFSESKMRAERIDTKHNDRK